MLLNISVRLALHLYAVALHNLLHQMFQSVVLFILYATPTHLC